MTATNGSTTNGTTPTWLRVDGDAIPPELKQRDQWVCWRPLPPQNTGGKPRKVPYDPVKRRNASCKDPATWNRFEQCWHPYLNDPQRYAGIGFEFSKDDEYAGIDLDKCRNSETGELHPTAQAVLAKIKSYAEVSPSGTGVKIIIRAKLPVNEGLRHKATLAGIEIEAYDQGRFFALTGAVIDDEHREIIEAQEALNGIVARIQAAYESKTTPASETTGRPSDDAIFRRALKRAIRIPVAKENDGSRRLVKVAIIAVEMDLSEADTIRLVSEVHRQAPFPSEFDERSILRRLASAEKKTRRGKSLNDGYVQSSSATQDVRLTDLGNARRLVKRHGADLRYCFQWNSWLYFDDQRWRRDESGEVERRAKDTVRQLWHDAAAEDDADKRKVLSKFAQASESADRISAMVKLAKSEPGIPVSPDELDRDPWLLCCPNGMVDLRTGKLREHRREDLITKLCPTPFNPDAGSYRWDRFVDSAFSGQQELIDFVQRLFGYFLTGSVREQLLAVFWGDGSNGKSTLISAYMSTIGTDYAATAPRGFMLAKKHDAHPAELVTLYGRRFIAALESGEGRSLDEASVKAVTGGDRIRARDFYERFFEFDPTHKIVLATNHRPTIKGEDEGIWRRIALVPFVVHFWEESKGQTGPPELKADPSLLDALEREREGILAWAVRGCLAWQRQGLRLPDEVRQATNEYRQDEDAVQQFINDVCVVGGDAKARGGYLYNHYETWCKTQGAQAMNGRQFAKSLDRKHFKKTVANGVWRHGIGIRTEATEGTDPISGK